MILIFALLAGAAYSKNLLFVGDSHTAGYFGQDIHKLLSKSFESVATFGHSSSAAVHWIGDNSYKLTGGKFNELFYLGKRLKDPNPIHWRVASLVPSFNKLIFNMAYHKSWQTQIGSRITPDIVVIALGANDARSISDQNGKINSVSYKKRASAIESMLDKVEDIGAQCIWIGPPNGIKKSRKNQETLYKYLRSKVANRCKFMSSNHYFVNDCDGVHFNCRALRSRAFEWAQEVNNFILNNRN